ncbi:alpha/beta fold hydrolase [Flagellimonas myxillae]|uniref:alpha/beta fold hydrolase n=1 Tax=Flagellimonas myxillae TaxID=2942214 RepID=UPI00201EF181|nr:alpha/beta hydrolase [Muricauda myxillae]MCL6265016.1 alpha/beta hydrolase [Muricauda myxillae]
MKKLIAQMVPLAYGQFFNLSSLLAPKRTAHMAFNVFCTIRKGKVLPQQKQYLDQAKLAMESVAGHQIQSYLWPGSRETVLLVHGWESNTFRWRNLIQKLKEAQYNIIAFDAPSHGYSSGKLLYAPLYEQVLHFMVKKHDPKYLVGHSMGGLTLLYNEYQNPNPGVEKMVVIGAPSEFYEIMDQYQNVVKFSDRFMGILDSYIHDRFGFHIREFSTSKFAKTNTKKGLLFHDKFDMVAPYHASEQVHASWKGSKLVTTEGLGHSMHQEEINNTIIKFLEA